MNIIPKPKAVSMKQTLFAANEITGVQLAEFSPLVLDEIKRIFGPTIQVTNEYANIVLKKRKMPRQSYTIDIDEQIVITAGDDVGAFYAVKTLKQWWKQEHYCGRIEDAPDLAMRGIMLDISRSKVPTLDTLKKLVDMFADLKINHLELYIEGFSYEYKSFPQVLQAGNYITIADYKALEQYARDRYMDFVPNENGFGHMTEWLALPEYHHLAECSDGFSIWGSHRPSSTMDPTNQESKALIAKMYADMIPGMQSSYFHMNFDEPYELGYGKSKPLCDQIGKEQVFVDYFNALAEVVRSYGKTPMLWGDFLVKHPEAVEKLPKDVIFMDWGYHLAYPFEEHAKMLSAQQVPFMLASGTSSWSTITGRYDDMIGSIRNSMQAAKKYHSLGMLITDWGDVGHLQYLPFSYAGFIYGAMCAWGEEHPLLMKQYLSDMLEDKPLASLIIKLSQYTVLEGEYRDYGSRLFSAILWAEHASRQADDVAFYLSRMQSNVIPPACVAKLLAFFQSCDDTIQQHQKPSLVWQEVENSVFLLKNLLQINCLLSLHLQGTRVSFADVILNLEAYEEKHKFLWCSRNKAAGYPFSVLRIDWLIQILNKIDRKENV